MREFVLFDTETTGAAENDRICQLAFARLGKSNTEWVAEFCNPTIPISFHAMAVHGITNEMVKDLPTFHQTQAAKRFCELNTNENVLVAHNAKFDIDMASKEGVIWQGEIIDTLRCAKHLLPNEESHALQYLRYSLGIYLEESNDEMTALRASYPDMMAAHNALFDIAILKLLLKKLSVLAGNSANLLIELTKKPILIKKLRFGKYKDSLLEDVAKKDTGYLEWLLREKKDDDDLRYSIRVALGQEQI